MSIQLTAEDLRAVPSTPVALPHWEDAWESARSSETDVTLAGTIREGDERDGAVCRWGTARIHGVAVEWRQEDWWDAYYGWTRGETQYTCDKLPHLSGSFEMFEKLLRPPPTEGVGWRLA